MESDQEITPPDESEITPSQLLMKVFEEFASSEPREVVVVWLNQDDELCWTTTAYRSHAVGMMKMVMDGMLKRVSSAEKD